MFTELPLHFMTILLMTSDSYCFVPLNLFISLSCFSSRKWDREEMGLEGTLPYLSGQRLQKQFKNHYSRKKGRKLPTL